MILLDTDILVDVLRRYKPALVWLETIEDEIALPGFAAMELVRGCKNKSEQDAVEKTLNRVRILWLSEKGCSKAYEQFLKLHLRSEIFVPGRQDICLRATTIQFTGAPISLWDTPLFFFAPFVT